VIAWVQPKLNELKEAYDNRGVDGDSELREAFSFFTNKQLKKVIEIFEKIIEDLNSLKRVGNAGKAPVARPKKRKSPAAQMAKVKILSESDLFGGIKSLPKTKIPNSMEVFLFRPDTRKLTYIKCRVSGGVLVSGMSIKGFDEKASWTRTLRKPEECLEVIKRGDKKEIKACLNALTTKPGKVLNRLNDKTLIIRTA
jgi:hypothetical protein